MATARPRIQGYIDSALHDRFLEWKQERGIAKDSEALNQLLAEYFGVSSQSPVFNQPLITIEQIEEINAQIDERLNKQFNELNVFRVEFKTEVWLQLKKEFAIWNESLQKVQEKINEVCDYNDRLRHRIAELTLRLEPPSETLADDIDEQALNHAENLSSQEVQALVKDLPEYSESPGDSLGEPPKLSKTDLAALLTPLTQSELARRLGCNKSMVSRHKEGGSFEEWSKARDPDAIAWRYDRKQQKFTPVR